MATNVAPASRIDVLRDRLVIAGPPGFTSYAGEGGDSRLLKQGPCHEFISGKTRGWSQFGPNFAKIAGPGVHLRFIYADVDSCVSARNARLKPSRRCNPSQSGTR